MLINTLTNVNEYNLIVKCHPTNYIVHICLYVFHNIDLLSWYQNKRKELYYWTWKMKFCIPERSYKCTVRFKVCSRYIVKSFPSAQTLSSRFLPKLITFIRKAFENFEFWFTLLQVCLATTTGEEFIQTLYAFSTELDYFPLMPPGFNRL